MEFSQEEVRFLLRIMADNASSDEVVHLIDTCPSGALRYIYK